MELRETGNTRTASPQYPDGSDSFSEYLHHELVQNAYLEGMLVVGIVLNFVGRRWRKQEQATRRR